MKKVVSATLAGALAVGMVPAMALADEAAPEVVADSDLELLVMTPAEAFDAGKVSAVKEAIADLNDIEFEYTGKAVSVTPTKVMPGTGAEITLDATYDCAYYAAKYDAKGKLDEATTLAGPEVTPKEVGKYVVAVTKSDYLGGEVVFLEFAIVAESIDGLKAYEPNALAADGGLSDEEFVYNGVEFKTATDTLGFKLNGAKVDNADLTVKVYKKNPATGLWATGTLKDAGEYVIEVTGKNEYAGSKVEIPVTVAQANLADLDLTLDNKQGTNPGTPAVNTIKGTDKALVSGLGAKAQLTLKSYEGEEQLTNGKGTYTYTLSLTDKYTDGNLTGTKDITFYVADTKLTAGELFYGEDKATSKIANGASITVNHSKGDKDVDLSKFTFCETSTYNKDEKVATSAVAIDAVTKKVATDITKPGTYNIAVNVDAAAADYDYYSDNAYAFTLTVVDGTVDAKNVAVLYEGKVVDAITHTYDGTDVVEDIVVVAKTDDGEKTLTAGKEYNYKIVDKDTGKEVSSIVNVNKNGYELTLSNGSYTLTGVSSTVVNITVEPIKPSVVRAANQVTVVTDATTNPVTTSTGLAYTGSQIVPVLEYYTAKDVEAAKLAAKLANKVNWDTAAVYGPYIKWTELPAGVYTTVVTDPGTVAKAADGKIEELGAYTFTIDEAEKVVNYDFTSTTPEGFNVVNGSVFKDVPAGKWYTEPVMAAYTLGYMNGIGGGLFDPNGAVTRGMAACILFNMAGETPTVGEGIVNNNAGFVTPFADVEPGMWYAEAIAWAEKAGVVNGWVEDGEQVFAPDQKITREQWAAMLANYAKVYGGFKAPAADALAGFADAAKVSGWAEESVAWAVENGVMGNGGAINAKANIIRAEAAAMAVNYQPVAL